MTSNPQHPFEAMLGVELYPLESRPSLVSLEDFCEVPPPLEGFDGFVDSLPDIYAGTEFKELVPKLFAETRALFKTEHAVFIHPASGSGAWEAALVNTLSPGDRVLAFKQGFFAETWAKVAGRWGLDVRLEPWDPRYGLSVDAIFEACTMAAAASVSR